MDSKKPETETASLIHCSDSCSELQGAQQSRKRLVIMARVKTLSPGRSV